MPSYDSGRVSTIGGLNIKARRSTDLEGIRFDANRSAGAPTSANDFVLYRLGNTLRLWDGATNTTLGGAGSGSSVPSFETIFAQDQTWNVAGTTLTIDNSTGNNDVLTVTNSGAGSGDLIQITNGGTGNDIRGTSNLWAVAATGVATFVGVILSGTSNALSSTGAAVWTLKDNDLAALGIGASGATTMLVFDTSNAAEIITATVRTVSVIANSNTLNSLLITNNTATTFGAAANDAGVVLLRSTSLTSGSLLQLQLTEGTLNGGFYLNCRDVTGSANVFTVGEDGAVVIAGVAGSNVLTVTAGDAVLSDGSLTITDNDDAPALSVVNNTTISANVIAFVSTTATHTGVTTNSYFHVSHSGLTSGTLARFTAVLADTSVAVVDIAVAGLTSGSALRVVSGTLAFTTGGKLIELSSTAAVAGNLLTATTTGIYTGTGLVVLSAGAFTTGIGGLSVVNSGTAAVTTGSQIRTSVNGTGAIATNGIISFTHTGDFTSTSAVNGGFVEIKANSTTAGTVFNVVSSGITTGIGVQLSNGTSAITSGSLLRVTTSGTGTIATNGIVSITHAGIFLSTSNAGVLDVRASALVGAGTVVNFMSTAASQTAANILNVEQSGATITAYTGSMIRIVGVYAGDSSTGNAVGITVANTTAGTGLLITNNALTLGAGTLISLVHGTSVIGAGSSMLRITSTGADTGTTTGCLIDLASNTATAGVMFLLTSTSLATGTAMRLDLNGITTGVGLIVAHTTAVIANGGSLVRISSTSIDTSTTTGSLLDLSSTASLASTHVLATFSGLTTGIGVSIVTSAITTGTALALTMSAASQTSAIGLSVIQTVTTTGYTGSLVTITGSSTTGSGNLLGITAVNTSAGDAVLITSNALVAGTSTALKIVHTTSVLGSGNSLLRISSSSVDTGATTGTLIDLAQTGAASGNIAVLLTDSSSSINARDCIKVSVTNSGAVLARPFVSSNVAVVASKFTKHLVLTDGTKTVTIWMSQDNTSPNTVLTGVKGDICLNGTGGATFYCSLDGTSWSTMG